MSQKILVRGFRSTWWTVLIHIAGVALGAVALTCLQGAAANVMLVCGGLIVLVAVYVSWNNDLRRLWLEDTGSGFAVSSRAETREISDDQVTGVGLDLRKNFRGGVVKSAQRRFDVWVDEDVEPVKMRYKLREGEEDPLAELIQRVMDKLAERAKSSLDGGQSIAGPTWTLDRATLEVGRGPRCRELPLDDLAAAGEFDGHVCIWMKGEERPAARIPAHSRNAYLLLNLVNSRIPERSGETPAAPEDGLGRILFERTPSAAKRVGMGLAGALVMVGSIPVFASEPFVSVGLFVVGSAMVGWFFRTPAFRCHEYGVWKSGLTGARQLRYDQVVSFTYGATRMYVNGVYSGTHVQFVFTPDDESGTAPIRYSAQLRNADEEIENLRDHIAGVIAARMSVAHSRGESVPWTRNLVFHEETLEHRPKGLLGRKEPRSFRYDEITGVNIDEGCFHIWVEGAEKSVVQENVAEENFFPGYFLLMDLLANRQSGEAEPETRDVEEAAQSAVSS